VLLEAQVARQTCCVVDDGGTVIVVAVWVPQLDRHCQTPVLVSVRLPEEQDRQYE